MTGYSSSTIYHHWSHQIIQMWIMFQNVRLVSRFLHTRVKDFTISTYMCTNSSTTVVSLYVLRVYSAYTWLQNMWLIIARFSALISTYCLLYAFPTNNLFVSKQAKLWALQSGSRFPFTWRSVIYDMWHIVPHVDPAEQMEEGHTRYATKEKGCDAGWEVESHLTDRSRFQLYEQTSFRVTDTVARGTILWPARRKCRKS